jgi:flagellar biosynthesis protein FlhA
MRTVARVALVLGAGGLVGHAYHAGTLRALADHGWDARSADVVVMGGPITVSGIQRVLQNLLRERISVRDFGTILEAIAEATAASTDLLTVTEHVRTRLARQLCNTHLDSNGALPVIALSPNWEQAFAESLVGAGSERQLALEPSRLHQFVTDLRGAFERAAQSGDAPVLLTSGPVRPYVRSLVERFRPQTIVMSQNEIHPKARLRSAGAV